MFEDWAALVFLPAMGMGFASLYLWFMLRPGFAEEDFEEVRAPWRRACTLLGGDLELPTPGDPTHTMPTIVAIIDGVRITIEARAWREWAYARNAVEYANRYQTVITARADGPQELRLSLSIEGRPDEEGDRFEDRFRISGASASAIPEWLSPAFKASAMQTHDYVFALEGPRAIAMVERLEDDSNQVVAATHAVAALAGRGAEVNERWERAAEQLGGSLRTSGDVWSPGGATTIVTEHKSCLALIDAVIRRHPGDQEPIGLRTRVRAKVSDGHELSFALHGHQVPAFARYFPRVMAFEESLARRYILRSPEGEAAAKRFVPEVARTLSRLPVVEVTRDSAWVTLVVDGLLEATGELQAAVEVATELARPEGTGPYR